MLLKELFVRLGLEVDEASFAKGELAAKAVEVGLEKLTEWAKEAAEGLLETVKSTIEYGDAVNKAAQATGIGRDALQELQYAAAQSDISAEGLSSAMGHLSRTMREAKAGSKEQAAAFSKLKIHVTGAGDKMRDMDDVLSDVADEFAELPDGTDKLALSMQIFGRGLGSTMIPLLNKGADGLEEMRREARELGLVMSDEDVKAAEDLKDTLRHITAVTQGLWRSAIAPLLPALNDLADRFLEWRKANAAIMKQRIREWIGYVIKGVSALADTFSFLERNTETIKYMLIGLAAAMAIVEVASLAAAGKTAAAWLIAAAPFIALGAVLTEILLIFDDFNTYQKEKADPKHFKSLFGQFNKGLSEWLDKPSNDPWFVVAIKDFVKIIREALELIDEFYEYTGRTNPAKADAAAGISKEAIQKRADVTTQATARQRVAMGQPLTDTEKAALQRSGVSPDAFVDKYGAKGPLAPPSAEEVSGAAWTPYAPGGGGSSGTTTITNAPVFQITQQPGESDQHLVDKIGTWWDGITGNAAASGGTD